MATSPLSTIPNKGCVLLILTLVIGAGMTVIVYGIRDLSTANTTTRDAIGTIIFGTIFTLVGAGFIALLFTSSKSSRRIKARRQAHPDQPWLWQKDWANGRVTHGSPGPSITLSILALGIGSLGAVILVNVIRDGGDTGAWIAALLVSLTGLGLAYAAYYQTARYRRYGRSTCHLTTNPGVIGGWFKAQVHSNLRLGPNEVVRIRFSCIRKYTTGSGDNRSTHWDIKWEEHSEFAATEIERTPTGRGSSIPIAFYVPRDCQPTTLDNSNDRILWQLELTAEVPGVDMKATYEVPVFITPESSDTPPPEAADLYRVTHEQSIDYAANSKIQVRAAQGGGTEIFAPPRRALGAALVLGIVALALSTATFFLIAQGAPLIMSVIFGLFALLTAWGTFEMLFGWTRTVLKGDTIEYHHSVLGIGRRKTLSTSEVQSVDVTIGMQSNDRAYYRVQLNVGKWKKYPVATALRDKNEARWLASILESHLEAE